jgi:hypothetical protein
MGGVLTRREAQNVASGNGLAGLYKRLLGDVQGFGGVSGSLPRSIRGREVGGSWCCGMGWPARRIVRTVIAAIMAAMTELRARRAAVSKRVWFPGWLMVVSTSRANVSSNAWTTWLLAGVIPSSWRMAALLVASWRGDWLVACRREPSLGP